MTSFKENKLKLTRKHLKELIKQTIVEDWWSKLEPDEQAAYIKDNNMAKSDGKTFDFLDEKHINTIVEKTINENGTEPQTP